MDYTVVVPHLSIRNVHGTIDESNNYYHTYRRQEIYKIPSSPIPPNTIPTPSPLKSVALSNKQTDKQTNKLSLPLPLCPSSPLPGRIASRRRGGKRGDLPSGPLRTAEEEFLCGKYSALPFRSVLPLFFPSFFFCPAETRKGNKWGKNNTSGRNQCNVIWEMSGRGFGDIT